MGAAVVGGPAVELGAVVDGAVADGAVVSVAASGADEEQPAARSTTPAPKARSHRTP